MEAKPIILKVFLNSEFATIKFLNYNIYGCTLFEYPIFDKNIVPILPQATLITSSSHRITVEPNWSWMSFSKLPFNQLLSLLITFLHSEIKKILKQELCHFWQCYIFLEFAVNSEYILCPCASSLFFVCFYNQFDWCDYIFSSSVGL